MTIRLTLLCPIAGDGTGEAVFDDDDLSGPGPSEAGAAGAALPRYPVVFRAPSARCARTARALALESTLEPALRGFDYGEWHGRTAAEVAAADPCGLSAWLTDPDAAPHGGESVRGLCRRITRWLNSLPPDMDRALVIAEPAVARAVLVHALSAPVRAFWHLTVPPLSPVSVAPCVCPARTRAA
ncbi:histidine phosphatase family protein [Streptomyces sp. Sce081]|uniref:histidine phosphatase family protein n=1 Tax=Streptomyces sp. Sce081 TaxID=3349853 RepID=UPI0035F2B70C